MKLLEKIRNKCFWIIDKKNKNIIKNELTLMRKVNFDFDEKNIINYQNKELKKLLDHACKSTTFYSNYIGKGIKSFPIIDKNIIKNNYDSFLSTIFEKKKLFKMTTSGSTGTPFTILQNYEKKKSTYAEVLYYNGKLGYDIGNRIVYLRALSSENKKNKITQFAENIYLIDCYDLSDKGIKSILYQISFLTKKTKAILMGYGSTFDTFRDYFSRFGGFLAKQCNLIGIISGSTMLFDDTRESMEKYFSCKCVSRYANEENGFLGQDFEKNNNVFFTNRAHFYYEILKINSNEFTAENEIGRIVITDFRNYAMPIIRYDTGDVGSLSYVYDQKGRKKQAIVNFGGRKIDVIYNCNGERISPHSVSTMMWKYPSINQYQLIQKNKGYFVVKLNCDTFLEEVNLKRDLIKLLGKEAIIKIEYVDEIPVLHSGKRKYIINEC